MIPKILHYCWMGGNPLPPSVKEYIKSWKKYCPDYEINEWNEDNFDISSTPLYVRQAYKAKMWSFVSDYVRLAVVYEYGGIYLDTDVEMIQSFDPLLEEKAFFGFEDLKYVNTGHGFGAEKGASIILDMMNQYKDISFINEQSYDKTPCPIRNTHVLIKHGLSQNGETQYLENNVIVFSSDYFCPKSINDGIIRKTKNTYSIHHFDATWFSEDQQKEKLDRWERKQKRAKQKARRAKIKSAVIKVLGEKNYNKIRKK